MLQLSGAMNLRALRCMSVPIRLASTAPKRSKRQDAGRREREGVATQKSPLTWTRNRWEVRRRRYMYDMQGLIKKGNVSSVDISLRLGIICGVITFASVLSIELYVH